MVYDGVMAHTPERQSRLKERGASPMRPGATDEFAVTNASTRVDQRPVRRLAANDARDRINQSFLTTARSSTEHSCGRATQPSPMPTDVAPPDNTRIYVLTETAFAGSPSKTESRAAVDNPVQYGGRSVPAPLWTLGAPGHYASRRQYPKLIDGTRVRREALRSSDPGVQSPRCFWRPGGSAPFFFFCSAPCAPGR